MALGEVERVVSEIRATPLVLDVDGALLRTDLLYETALAYVRANPLRILQILLWLLRGRAVLKQELASRVELNVNDLPASEDLVAYAVEAAAHGREVCIATAADGKLARAVAARFPFVKFVLASDGVVNLKAGAKAERLLGYAPRYRIGEGLKRAMPWYAGGRSIENLRDGGARAAAP